MNEELLGILAKLDKAIAYCEGAMMVGKGGDYLHNFAFCIQDKLITILHDMERLQLECSGE